jgi:hypothetical protein
MGKRCAMTVHGIHPLSQRPNQIMRWRRAKANKDAVVIGEQPSGSELTGDGVFADAQSTWRCIQPTLRGPTSTLPASCFATLIVGLGAVLLLVATL